jgi:site-specific recombinase XerD
MPQVDVQRQRDGSFGVVGRREGDRNDPREGRELSPFCFTEPTGVPLARRTFERAFERVLVKAGLGLQHSPKSLRHSFASILISSGANLVYVSRQMGHASVAITEKVYTRWLPQAVPAVHALDEPGEAPGSKRSVSGSSAAANSATVQAIG